MKTVEYHGKTFEISNWVNYIVAEEDGTVWAFEEEPSQMDWEIYGDANWYSEAGFFEVISLQSLPANDGHTYKPMKVLNA